LLFGGRSERQLAISPTAHESLAGVETPAGFTLVGTATRTVNQGVTVAYSTALPSANAFAALIASLAAAGWEQEDDEFESLSPSVFNLADGRPARGTVCRDGARLSVRVTVID